MGSKAESISLEETNKHRAALGLSLIGVAPEGAEGEAAEVPEDRDAIAEANYAQRREDMAREKNERETRERIEKARNKSAYHAKLKGSTLAQPSTDDSLSAKDWIKKQKKREKQRQQQLAKQRELDQAEADRIAEEGYGEEDLKGLKVGHEAEEFEEGQDVILTLKDSGILGGEEDELQNVNLAEDAKIKAARERKRKAQAAYTGYDDEEFEDEGRIGERGSVLAKYDEDYADLGKGGGLKSEGFRLGGAVVEKKAKVDEDVEMGSAPAQKIKLNLDYAKEFEVSDYAKEGDVGFKKPKKKKAKRSTRRATGAEEGDMAVDGEPTFTRRIVEDGPENLVDDDDLQAALARTRRVNAKKKPRAKPEDIAAQIAQQREEEDRKPKVEQDAEAESGLITLDDTSEFVRNVSLDSRALPVKRERLSPAPSAPAPTGPSTSDAPVQEERVSVKIERAEEGELDEDEEMTEEDSELAEMAARDGLSLEEYRQKIDNQMVEMAALQAAKAEEEKDDEPEPTVGQGMAGVLALLKHQGALKARTAEDEEREKVQKQKDLWLADYRRRMAQRELEKIRSRGGDKDQAQREWENRMREQQEAKDALEIYKNYKPDVQINYHDEFGRQMTPKEAWKSLSHKFHGKTSGRMKTEKRLKKIEDERKQLSMNSSDTPLGMTNAFNRRQQATGEAHMVLSVGNKQSVQSSGSKKR